MDDRFRAHVDQLVADAEREVASGDWKAARALAEAALSLDPTSSAARRVVHSAETALGRMGERRQLTVMFTDVVGSTELASRADPEIVRDILRSYQGACADVVSGYDGHIAMYIGDGIVVYFGYPQPHEDDPTRAVLAGLALLETMKDVSAAAEARHGLPIDIRVAVHTGLVVRAEMGAPGRRDVDAIVGVTPNVAARLQEHARPGSLIISADTHELVKGTFRVRSAGALVLRGIPEPLEAFEVIGDEPEPVVVRTEFFDREAEMAQLVQRWAAGGTTAFLLTGEPGIGKSRLAEEFRTRLTAGGTVTLQSQCSPFHTAGALYPARQLVAQACGVDTRDPPERVVPAIREALAAIGKADLVGVFADLLGLPPSDDWEPPQLDGPLLRETTLSTLVTWLASVAADTPILIVIDDLQWVDPSTQELISRILARPAPGLLLLLTGRDNVQIPWTSGITVIKVSRLPDADARSLAAALPEARTLSPEDIDSAVERSAGVPFFLEELIRASDAAPSTLEVAGQTSIPTTLLGPLLARLSGPGVDLGLCQVLATIGREADYELISTVVGIPETVLDARLRVLTEGHIIEPCPGERRAYRFGHELLRELAYETQLGPDRRRLHSAIADTLEAIDFYGIPADAGTIAFHLERCGRIAAAVHGYMRTSSDLLSHGALTEAVELLDHCLALVDEVPNAGERVRLELEIRQARGMAWVSNMGYAYPAAVDDFRRCVELCEDLGPGSAPSIEAIWYFYVLTGQLERAEELVVVDRRRIDPGPLAVPEEGPMVAIRFFRGDLAGSMADMASFLSSSYVTTATDTTAEWPLPDDPIVNVLSFLCMARMISGDLKGARQAFEQGAQRAAKLPFPHGPFGSAYVRSLYVTALRWADLDHETVEVNEELSAIADLHGFGFYQMMAHGNRVMVETHAGGPPAMLGGVTLVSQASGMIVWFPYFLLEEARAFLAHGEAAEAAPRIDAAVANIESTGARVFLAEALHLRGRARLAAGDDAGVEDLDHAIEVAREQGARLWELKALISRRQAAGGEYTTARLAELVATLDGFPDVDVARGLLGTG